MDKMERWVGAAFTSRKWPQNPTSYGRGLAEIGKEDAFKKTQQRVNLMIETGGHFVMATFLQGSRKVYEEAMPRFINFECALSKDF